MSNYNIGYTALSMLEFLHGEPFDDRALDFIHALRPSDIRSVEHGAAVECDAMPWRVTVHKNEDGTIAKIWQEVEVGLRTADNGHCLVNRIPKGEWPKADGISIVNSRAVRKLQGT